MVQRCLARPVLTVGIGAVFQQQARKRSVAMADGAVEHGAAVMPGGGIDVGAMGEQQLRNGYADARLGTLGTEG